MNRDFHGTLSVELDALRSAGTYKEMNWLDSPQAPHVQMEGRGEVLVMSSNNYLGLADHPEVLEGAQRALDHYGPGTASVRFICGTFTIHRELESALAELVGTSAALSYVSAWSANEGLPQSIMGEDDVVISDEFNHASIIDSIRLAKVIRKCSSAVYKHSNMDELKAALEANRSKRRRLIYTDGVFSMEGDVARLPEILQLAKDYDAIVAVDDSHGSGVVGETGRGVAEHFGVLGEVDIITSTLGKALGGAAGGFTASSAELVDMLTQVSRPQLFSNALPPVVAGAALAAVRTLRADPGMVQTLRNNALYFREGLLAKGLKPIPGPTPIVPIIIGETANAIRASKMLLERGVFVTGFGFPVVPQGTARLRCQVSAAHSRDDLNMAIESIASVCQELGIRGED